MTHGEISRKIRRELGQANKSLTTAERFHNTRFYHQGETKLKHAEADIRGVGTYRVSRVSAFRHIIGHSPERVAGYSVHNKDYRHHPKGCMCPFHGGHK